MSACIKRVPWSSMGEWMSVKSMLSSGEVEDLLRAYEVLLLWKARCSNLPAKVECTLGVVQALTQEARMEKTGSVSCALFQREEDLKMVYSTALLRFINHASASTSVTGDTLYLVAERLKIPDWIINLRHDAAHSAEIPPCFLLKKALHFAREWLFKVYWQVQGMSEVDGDSLQDTGINLPPTSISRLLKDGVASWRACQNLRNKRHFIELDDEKTALIRTFAENLEATKLLRGHISSINLNTFFAKVDKGYDHIRITTLSQILLNVIDALSKKDTKANKCLLEGVLQSDFLSSGGSNWKMWAPVLLILHEIDSMQGLLESLLNVVGSQQAELIALANGWLKTLAPSIASLRRRWRLQNAIGVESDSMSGTEEETEDYFHLPLRQPPVVLMGPLRAALLEPTPDAAAVMGEFVQLLDPPLPEGARLHVKNLLKIFSHEGDDQLELLDTLPHSEDELMAVVHGAMGLHAQPPGDAASKWRAIQSDSGEWRRSPLGLLPHQSQPDLELPELTWRPVAPTSRKRPHSLITTGEDSTDRN